MNLTTLVWREIFERKSQLLTSFASILLGITVIVSIKNITYFSEKAVAREMDSLGANVLVLPKSPLRCRTTIARTCWAKRSPRNM